MTEALFVGAGFSAFCGYAVTGEIFPLIVSRLKRGALFRTVSRADAPAYREQLGRLLTAFLPGVAIEGAHLPLITDVLSLLDYLISHDEAAGRDIGTDDLVRLRFLLQVAVLEILSRPISSHRANTSSGHLDRLANWIVKRGLLGFPISTITTNYDLVLESAIYRRLNRSVFTIEDRIDYGFSWRQMSTGELEHRPRQPLAIVLKLHGSLNWLRCRLCGFVYIDQTGTAFQNALAVVGDPYNTCHCGHSPLTYVMVGPSMARTAYEQDLGTIWRAATECLRVAERWSIVGYSLPHEDIGIRSIFLRALRSRETPVIADIFDRDPQVEARFRLLFPRANFSTTGVEQFIRRLKV